jgi:uncharacterized membrane protein (DUF485 family)
MSDDPVALPKASPVGLALFAVYLLAYGGFMYLAAFRSSLLGTEVVAGVNLAIVYGMALIVGAFALAVIYLFAPTHDDEGGAS